MRNEGDQTRCEHVTSGTHQAASENTLTRPHARLSFFLVAVRPIAGWQRLMTRIVISFDSAQTSRSCCDAHVFVIVLNRTALSRSLLKAYKWQSQPNKRILCRAKCFVTKSKPVPSKRWAAFFLAIGGVRKKKEK